MMSLPDELGRSLSANLTGDFQMEYARVPLKIMRADHYHDYYEVCYFMGGEMTYFIENKSFTLRNHDIVFINTFTYHRTLYKTDCPAERVLFKFSPGMLDQLCPGDVSEKVLNVFKKKRPMFQSEIGRQISNIIQNQLLSVYCEGNSAITLSRLRLQFADLLLFIASLPEQELQSQDPSPENNRQKVVSEIANHINLYYRDSINLDVLSKRFFLSKYYLCRIFKDITGTGIIDFINRKRLVEAEKLIRSTNMSISDISEQVGFKSVDHFIFLFKRNYNHTPGAFKKHNYPLIRQAYPGHRRENG